MPGDTILAGASPAGVGERAVLRLSGPRAFEAAALVFDPPLARERGQRDGRVRVRGGSVEAFALTMPGPRSFTGEDVVELHLVGSPLLLELVQEGLLAAGASLGLRLALPGEFTARACRNGRLDACRAEGLLMLLHAADRRAAGAALPWLRGGLSRAVVALRGALQDALALLESGLDFDQGETGEVPAEEVGARLDAVAGEAERLLRSVPAAAPGGEVLLLGAANAGKSSLCNALLGRETVLVDSTAGTTRDLIRVELEGGGVLWDAPGDLERPGDWDAAALALRDRLAGRAGAVVVVLDACAPRFPPAAFDPALPVLAIVWTKGDLVDRLPRIPETAPARLADRPRIRTSAVTGEGLGALRDLLAGAAHCGTVDAGGPLRAAFAAVGTAVGRARETLPMAELAAFELQAALRELDGVAGEHSPEDLLERIYGRFCLGK